MASPSPLLDTTRMMIHMKNYFLLTWKKPSRHLVKSLPTHHKTWAPFMPVVQLQNQLKPVIPDHSPASAPSKRRNETNKTEIILKTPSSCLWWWHHNQSHLSILPIQRVTKSNKSNVVVVWIAQVSTQVKNPHTMWEARRELQMENALTAALQTAALPSI